MALRKTIAWVLWPFTMWYAIGVTIRNILFELGVLKQTIPPVTTIGVGNLVVGGSGKTPMTDYLLGVFSNQYNTAMVSRGYKRKSSGCVVYESGQQATEDGKQDDGRKQSLVNELGDETAMLLEKHPNVTAAVCKKRNEAINRLLSSENPPQLVILDDVYQHRYVKPTINILLTEYGRLYSDDHILPFGDLREPRVESRRANVIVVTKSPKKINRLEKHLIANRLKAQSYQKMFFSYIDYGEPVPMIDAAPIALHDVRQVLCVTGIANPSPLLDELKHRGIKVEHLAFSDHHDFNKKDIEEIKRRFEAIENPAKIILTTEKDAIRLRELLNGTENAEITENTESLEKQDLEQSDNQAIKQSGLPIYILPMSIRFHDENGNNFPDYITSIVKENISFTSRLTSYKNH